MLSFLYLNKIEILRRESSKVTIFISLLLQNSCSQMIDVI